MTNGPTGPAPPWDEPQTRGPTWSRRIETVFESRAITRRDPLDFVSPSLSVGFLRTGTTVSTTASPPASASQAMSLWNVFVLGTSLKLCDAYAMGVQPGLPLLRQRRRRGWFCALDTPPNRLATHRTYVNRPRRVVFQALRASTLLHVQTPFGLACWPSA